MKFYVGKFRVIPNYANSEHTICSPDRHLVELRHDPNLCDITEFETEVVWEGYTHSFDENFYAVFVVCEGNLICISYDYKEEWKNGEDVGFKFTTFSRSETMKAR